MQSLERMQKEDKKEVKKFGRQVRTYTPDFRKEVVAYSEKYTIEQTADHFKVPQGTVNTWRAKSRKNKLQRIGDKKNIPNSKPHGPRENTTPMPDNTLPSKTKVTSDMTTAERELVQLSEKLWKELSVIEDAIKLLRLYKTV